MASMICKFYGVVDITAALIIFFADLPIPDIIKIFLALVLVFKGIPSLLA